MNQINQFEIFKKNTQKKKNQWNRVTNLTSMGDQHYVILEPFDFFVIDGIVSIKILKGSVSVMGYQLDQSKDPVTLYSSKNNSLLSIFHLKKNQTEQTQTINEWTQSIEYQHSAIVELCYVVLMLI